MIVRSKSAAKYVFFLLVVGIVASTYAYYAKSCARLDTGRKSVRDCEALAAQIDQLRKSPQKARFATRSSEDLGGVIEKAAAAAQLARDRVLRIDPQPHKRLGKTDYLDQATEVELLSVSLKQLIGFLCSLTEHDSGLAVGTIRLQAPHSSAAPNDTESWSANIVLTQRIYAPTTARH